MANFKEGLDAFTNKEYDKALEILTPFAEEGDAEAQFHLAKIYENGYGVSKDIEKAIKWYQLASKGGNPKAQNNLALLYEEGIGVLEGYKDTGLFLLRNVAKKGADRAQYNLGMRYATGDGVPQDYMEAARLFKHAANKNIHQLNVF